MTKIIKIGRQRAIFSWSKKVKTEFYHYISRENIDIIAGVAPYQVGILIRLPRWGSHAILMLKWTVPGMLASDVYDDLRRRYRFWKERDFRTSEMLEEVPK